MSKLKLAAWVLLALALRVPELAREGFSPDEELTVFAVRGISETGVPRFPSGVVYGRGPLHSYTAWAAGRVFGDTLTAYRMPSLLAGCAAVVLTVLLALRLGGSSLFAGLFACAATWLVVTSTWARFYGLFACAFLGAVLVFLSVRNERRRDVLFLLLLVSARLLHEAGVTLLALPLFEALSRERRRTGWLLGCSVGTLAVVQLVMSLLSRGDGPVLPAETLDVAGMFPLLPGSTAGLAGLALAAIATGALLRVLGAPWAVCAAGGVTAATLNLGLILAAAVGMGLARPADSRHVARWGLATLAASIVTGVALLKSTSMAALSFDLVWSLVGTGLAFPSAGVSFVLREWPIAVALAAAGAALGFRRSEVRATVFLALAVVLFVGAVPIGPKARYFVGLLPLLAVLGSILPAAVTARRTACALAVALAVLVVGEHERASRASELLEPPRASVGLSRLRSAPVAAWSATLRAIPPSTPVVCNDDLACRLAGRRPDYWLLRSASEAAVYGVQDGNGWRSVYTGAPIVLERADLVSRLSASGRPEAVIVALDTVKYGALALPGTWSRAAGGRLSPWCTQEGLQLWRMEGEPLREREAPQEETTCPPVARE